MSGLLKIAGFAALAVFFYWELALPSWILADYDVWTYFYPLRAYAAEAIRSGRFPLWNPDTFLGAPFFANPQTSLLYPGTALFYILPVAYAYSLSIILHVFLAASFMYAFLRRAFEVSGWAAAYGACAFAFGGFMSSQVGHINQLSATAWLPAIALCVDIAFRRASIQWGVAGGAILGVQLLAGHAQESYMTLWAVASLLAWRALQSYRRPRRLLLAPGVGLATVAIGFGLAAVQVLPTIELSGESIRAGGLSYAEGVSFSLPPDLLIRALLPGYWFNVSYGESIGYVGAAALALAATGLLAGRAGPALWAAGLAATGLALALGGANPVYPLLFDVVPGFDLFRVPARWLLVYSFGAASLAAIGLEWLLASPRPTPSRGRLALGASLAGVAMTVVAGSTIAFQTAVPGRIVALWGTFPTAVGLLGLLGARHGRRFLGPALLALLVVELRLAAMDLPQRSPAPAAAIAGDRPVPVYLTGLIGQGRILSVAPTEYELPDHRELEERYPDLGEEARFWFTSALKLDEVMSPNVPLRYGLSTVDGYDGGVLPLLRFLDIASLLVPRDRIRSDGVLRTRMVAVPEEELWEVFDIRAVIAHRVVDVELGGMRYDVATPRTFGQGDRLRLQLPRPMAATAVGLLGSMRGPQARAGERGRMLLTRGDGSREELPLRQGAEVFHEAAPSPLNVAQPSPEPTGGPLRDSAVRISVSEGAPLIGIEWEWADADRWTLRAATIESAEGEQEQLVLRPGLRRSAIGDLKIYERGTRPSTLALAPTAERLGDREALEQLGGWPSGQLVLSEDADIPIRGERQEGVARFARLPSPPERLTYERVDGSGAGYLLVNDAWYPGWRAEVDGAESPVYRANVHFKAVWVPSAARRVTLVYEPTLLRAGAALSLITMALVAVLLGRRGPLRRWVQEGRDS